jgi:hypothetical protein
MKRSSYLMIATLFTIGHSIARADKLSDFQEALQKSGCESIPYSDLQSTCKSQQEKVHEWCDGSRGPTSCGSEGITRQLKTAIETARRQVEAAKDNRDKADQQRSRSGLSDSDKRTAEDRYKQASDNFDAASKQSEQANKTLEARSKAVNDAIYNIGYCIDYRRAVMNAFAAAIDRARGENDPSIVPIARQLKDSWEAGKSGHEQQITARENALQTCKDSRP